MSLQSFFDNFALLADSPNGVPKLRELILQLALEGTLVSQNPTDESAAVLLRRIEFAKEKLTNKPTPRSISITEENGNPYSIPETWAWTTLGNVGLINPRNEFDDDEMASFVPMKLVPQKYGERVKTEKRFWREIKKAFTHFAEGDVVLAKITPCFQNGKAAVMRGLENNIGAGTTELHVFRPIKGLMSSEYVLIYLKSPRFVLDGIPRMTGTAGQKRVPNDYFALNPFPLPPLEEQKRIVAKVDELLGLCDELETRQRARRQSRMRFNQVTLAPLNNAASLASEKFGQAAVRLADNFAVLYDSAETVDILRSTILQLAVQGKLVPQDPSEELAILLLKAIEEKRKKLVKSSELKKLDPTRTFDPYKLPLALPKGWDWKQLGDLSLKLGAGSTPLGGRSVYREKGVKFLRSQNVWNDGLRLDEVAHISEEIHEDMSGTQVEPGDVLLNITGASIGRSSIVPEDIGEANVSQHVSIIRLVDKRLRFFIHLCMISPYIQGSIMQTQVGISREGLSMRSLKEFVLPIPPLGEQKRIVAKVNQLMALCDELETKLRQAEIDSEKLMNAAVQHVLASVAISSCQAQPASTH